MFVCLQAEAIQNDGGCLGHEIAHPFDIGVETFNGSRDQESVMNDRANLNTVLRSQTRRHSHHFRAVTLGEKIANRVGFRAFAKSVGPTKNRVLPATLETPMNSVVGPLPRFPENSGGGLRGNCGRSLRVCPIDWPKTQNRLRIESTDR